MKIGLSHGAYCLGYCWLLMAFLFAGGVINLLWVVGIALLVLGERVLLRGNFIGRFGGIGMLALATYMMLPDTLIAQSHFKQSAQRGFAGHFRRTQKN